MELEKRKKMAVEIPAEVAGMFDLANNMEGVIPRLPQVAILHSAQMFELPDGSKPESFTAVILDQHPTNAWWKEKIKKGDPPKKPDCSSLNAVKPDDGCENPQSELCEACPHNQWGSDREGGKGKDCKNMKRLHVMTKDALLPRRLTVPPTSITSFEYYMTVLVDMGLPYACVETELTLKKHEEGTNIYSELQFEKIRVLETDEIIEIGGFIKKYKDEARLQDIEGEEYVAEEKPDIPF